MPRALLTEENDRSVAQPPVPLWWYRFADLAFSSRAHDGSSTEWNITTGDWNFLHSEIQSLPTTSGLASVSEANTTTTFPHMATPEDSLVPSSLTTPLVVVSVSRPDTTEDDSYAHPVRASTYSC